MLSLLHPLFISNTTKPNTLLYFQTVGTIKGGIYNEKEKHPAMFHPELPLFFIQWLTDKNDVVLDPFMGSGATAVASVYSKRNWIGFDINEFYDMIVKKRMFNNYWKKESWIKSADDRYCYNKFESKSKEFFNDL